MPGQSWLTFAVAPKPAEAPKPVLAAGAPKVVVGAADAPKPVAGLVAPKRPPVVLLLAPKPVFVLAPNPPLPKPVDAGAVVEPKSPPPVVPEPKAGALFAVEPNAPPLLPNPISSISESLLVSKEAFLLVGLRVWRFIAKVCVVVKSCRKLQMSVNSQIARGSLEQ